MAFLILLTVLFTSSVDVKEQNNRSLLTIVKAYADAMIEDGRDIYGEEHSPLFAAALDRAAMKLAQLKISAAYKACGTRTDHWEGQIPKRIWLFMQFYMN